jgi:hypothetical protein
MDVRVDVITGMGLVAVPMRTGRRRVEVDAGRLEGSLLVGALVRLILLGIVARQVAPGPHRAVRAIIVSRGSILRV